MSLSSLNPPLQYSLAPPQIPTFNIDLKPSQISASNEESIPNKSIVKPAAASKSEFSYEQTLAKMKRLEKEHQERPVSFTLSGRNYLRLQEDLKLDESEKRYNIS